MTAIQGKLGRASWKGVWGWALDAASPETKVTVEILLNDEVVGHVVARDLRAGLKTLPEDQRYCGFQFMFPNGLSALSRHVVRARSAADGTELEDSPYIVEPAPGFDPALERTVENALQVAAASAHTPEEIDAPLRFVAGQIEQLIALRESMQGGEGAALPPELAELKQRWSGVLAGHDDTDRLLPGAEGAGGGARRILVIGDAVRVLDDSARALLAHMQSLIRVGAVVEFAAADFRQEFAPHVAAVERIGASYHRPPLSLSVEDVLRRNRGLYETVLIHRITNFEKYAALARYYCPLARVVFDVDNLFFVRMLRRAALQSWAVGTEKGEALRTREMMAAWEAQAVITSSAFEADLLRRGVPRANVHVVAWPAEPRPTGVAFADRHGVGFIGDFQQHADYDAAAWLLEILMPAVWAIDPSITCVVAGRNMPEPLRTLSRERVIILDLVTGDAADTEALLDRVRLTAATQRAGAGLAAMVVASLAAGVPCIGSSVALEGLVLQPELRAACVADDVQSLAARVCALHNDAAENAALAEAGLRFVAEELSPASIDQRMKEAVGVLQQQAVPAAPAPGIAVAAQ